MNLFLPQSIIASRELEYLCSVLLEIISPQHSDPVISINEDSLIGSFTTYNNYISDHRPVGIKLLFNP